MDTALCVTARCPAAVLTAALAPAGPGVKAEPLRAAHTFCAFKRFGLSMLGLVEPCGLTKSACPFPHPRCQKMNLWDTSSCLQSAAMREPSARGHRDTCTHTRAHTRVLWGTAPPATCELTWSGVSSRACKPCYHSGSHSGLALHVTQQLGLA